MRSTSNPQALAFGHSSHVAAIRGYLSWGPAQFERYASMMVFDSLICNADRHLTNFGVLRDSRTGELLGMALVFDNGRSPFFNLSFDQTDGFAREGELSLLAWPQATFEEQAARLMGDVQRGQLGRLAGFEFENSEDAPRGRGREAANPVRWRCGKDGIMCARLREGRNHVRLEP